MFKNSEFYHLLVNGKINLPDSRQLPELTESNRESEVPYIVVADGAFPLTAYCVKPYFSQKLSDSKRIFVKDYQEHDVLQEMLLEFYQTGFEFHLHACIYNLTMQQK